jgi:PTS system nitrogen regulatory IIA component
MDIGDWLDREAIAYRSGAANKRQALSVAADLGARTFGLDAAAILEALSEREQLGSTGVGHGVALPHARLPGLDRLRAVFVRLETPVDFGAVDDQPVDLLFALFAPPHASSEHLRGLARVSRLLRRPEQRQRLRQAHSADAIYALLAQEAEATTAA